MRARLPLALAARLAAPGSDDATMTDPDGRGPEETTKPGADAAGAAAGDTAAAEGLDEADADEADAEEAGFDQAEADESDYAGFDDLDTLGEEAAVPSAAAIPGAAEGRASGTGGAGRRLGRRGTPEPEHMQTASDRAVHIDDRISKVFVIGIAVIFGLIFLNALLLGKGGLFVPTPTPTPVPSASPAPSVTPGASASPATSASPAASTSPAPSVTPAVSASPAPSASASAAP